MEEKKARKLGITIGRALGEKARNCNWKSFGRTGRREETERLNGEKNGQMKAKIETAKNMLKDKMDKKSIIKYTGLTLKELERITV